MKRLKNKLSIFKDRMQLKSDLLVLKGIYADMCSKVDWNINQLTTEQQLEANKLLQQIVMVEDMLNHPAYKNRLFK